MENRESIINVVFEPRLKRSEGIGHSGLWGKKGLYTGIKYKTQKQGYTWYVLVTEKKKI